MLHLIKEIVKIEPYILTLKFNSGETRKVNLENKLKTWTDNPNSSIGKLLEGDYFKSVKLNKEMETIYWDNGIDFCPNVLYEMSEPVLE